MEYGILRNNKARWLLKVVLVLITGHLSFITSVAQVKREFRGAWIQCVNGQFKGIGTQNMQRTLSYQLDELQKDGCNAIIFQVRPECDALYESQLEPWSFYLTGEQGRAPQPYWDPLAWMVNECHKRGMELHAWINPYRAKTKTPHKNASNHIVVQHPDWCFEYDGLTLLNPALKENRDYICEVVRDIVERYDVDGLHIDDYFYPYPAPGVKIPDDLEFQYMNRGISNRGDWRRDNVNQFIRELYETVHRAKPWVKVGISPFGIYRNQKSDPNGSRTNGLQNYDDLYADVLHWDQQGWMDYCVPQIYWEIGNKAADYDELIKWWSRNIHKSDLYIGEDIERTAKFNQQAAKRALYVRQPQVKGTVLWYAKAAVDNVGNYGTSLRTNYWKRPVMKALPAAIKSKAPGKVRKVKVVDMGGQQVLFWTPPKAKQWDVTAERYAVYRFAKNETIDTECAGCLVAITADTHYELPAAAPGSHYVYVVTALNRIDVEGKLKKVKVKY